MKKTKLHLVLMALFLVRLSTSAFSQMLWGEAHYGMTFEHVQRLHPEAATPGSNGQTLASGAVEKLRIGDHEFMGKRFTVGFYFLHDKLSQVTVSMDPTRYSGEEMGEVFPEIVKAFTARYGTETERRDLSNTPFKHRKAIWETGETRITVLHMQAKDFYLLNVVYQPRTAKPGTGKPAR